MHPGDPTAFNSFRHVKSSVSEVRRMRLENVPALVWNEIVYTINGEQKLKEFDIFIPNVVSYTATVTR